MRRVPQKVSTSLPPSLTARLEVTAMTMAKKWRVRKLLHKKKKAKETKVSQTEENRPQVSIEEPKDEEPKDDSQVEEEEQHCEEEEETQCEEPHGGEKQQRWESFENRLAQRMRKSTLKKDTVGQEKGLEEMAVQSMASRKGPVWSQLMHELGENFNSTREIEGFPIAVDDNLDIPRTISASSIPSDESAPPKIASKSIPAGTTLKIDSERESMPIIYSKSNAVPRINAVVPTKISSESDTVSVESPAPSTDSTLTPDTPESNDESVAYTGSYTRATRDSDSSASAFERAVLRVGAWFLCNLVEVEPSSRCSSVRSCRR